MTVVACVLRQGFLDWSPAGEKGFRVTKKPVKKRVSTPGKGTIMVHAVVGGKKL